MKSHMVRRDVLKTISLGAGATLLAPLLEQIAASASGAEARVTRKRMVFIVQSNGLNPAHLLPSGVERPKHGRPTNDTVEELSLVDRTLHKAMEPLASYQDRMTFLQGLSGRIAVSDHSANQGALGACPANMGPMLQTIDSAVSELLPGIFSHVAIGYGGSIDPMNYSYSASGPGKAVPIICSPDLAFKSLFGSVVEGMGRQAFDRRTNLLDFMVDDVKRVQSSIASEEKQKLDRYLDAFDSLHQRQQVLLDKADLLRTHAPQLGEKLTSSQSSLILESQFEIATAALLSGLTQVVTLVSGGGGQRFGSFPEFNIPDLHGIGHGNSYGRTSSEDCFVELRQFHTKLIAELAKKLAESPEGNGTMLDNTLIVYLSDSGEAHHPSLYEWPVVLIGDLGGSLKTRGRYLQLPQYGAKGHRTTANLYCTLLHALGNPRDKFGVIDPDLKEIDQTGPIGELLS
jgi:Protein of unknown function (DUF1552)